MIENDHKQAADGAEESGIKKCKRNVKLTEEQRRRRAENDRKRRANMTEEQRKKKAEYHCKWYSNLTEEQRNKNNRKRLINMTDEQRKRKAENERQYRANMTEEQRKIKLAKICEWRANMPEEKRIEHLAKLRDRYATMTEEQRLKKKDLRHKNLANKTEEQRIKKSEYDRKWRANMTEEQRIRKMENARKRRANMTEEQRLKRTEYHREQRANMTEEQRMKKAENVRKRRSTEEQRIKNIENARKQRANMTEEQHLMMAEYYRNRWVNMTEEQRMKRAEDSRKRRANMTEEQRIKNRENARKRQSNMTEEQRKRKVENERKRRTKIRLEVINKGGHNPLENLIKMMVDNNADDEIIFAQSKNFFQGILELIGFEYKYNTLDYKTSIQNLVCEIDIYYLIQLLRNWQIWAGLKCVSYDALFLYLQSSMRNFKLQREAFLLDELKRMFSSESFISVTCSMKQLQTLFYYKPQNYLEKKEKHLNISSPPHQLKIYLPKYIIVLPHVSTRITLPNFSMTHQNNHSDEYTLLNMPDRQNVNKNKSPIIFKRMKNNSEQYLKQNVIKLFNQLSNILKNDISDNSTIEKYAEVLMILSIFENDLAQCPDVIDSNYKYNRNSALYPYVRYLGFSDDSDICISVSDQQIIKENVLNVRLKHTRHPNISFVIENFNVPYEIVNNETYYILDKWFVQNINTCISYHCLICDEALGSTSPSHVISDHFIKYHGLEPDWECTKCFKSFANDYLINNDWKHDCD